MNLVVREEGVFGVGNFFGSSPFSLRSGADDGSRSLRYMGYYLSIMFVFNVSEEGSIAEICLAT